MADPIDRRLHYFDGQFLKADDFTDEQSYHVDRQRRHNRLFHTPGIAEGLAVTADQGAREVTVAPGTAVDGAGRQIVLPQSRTVAISEALKGKTVLLVVSYHEEPADAATTGGGGDTRWLERPQIEALEETEGMPPPESHIRLARLQIDAQGRVTAHDDDVRSRAGVSLRGEAELEKLVLLKSGVAPSGWPSLSCSAANMAWLSSALTVNSSLSVKSSANVAQLVVSGDLVANRNATLKGSLTIQGELIASGGVKALTVKGPLQVDGKATVGTAQRGAGLQILNKQQEANGDSLIIGRSGSHLRLGYHGSYSWIQSHGSKPLAINPLGNNVGILTTAPAAALHIGKSGLALFGPNRWNAYLAVGGDSRTRTDASVAASNGNLHIDAKEGSFGIYLNHYAKNKTVLNATGGNVGIGTTNPVAKLHVVGDLLGAAKRIDGAQLRMVSGSTPATTTAWKQYNNNPASNGVFVDINTSAAGFKSTPFYITSLGGNGGHWTTMGATSIYSASKTGFRVYVNQTGITPANARSRRFHINWLAIGA